LAAATTLEEHLKNVVGVHAATTAGSATLVNLFEVETFIVHLSLFGVVENLVTLRNLLKLRFGLFLLLLALA